MHSINTTLRACLRKGNEGTLHAVVSKKKKRGAKNYIYKVFQTIHSTLVIKSVPRFWHKGVGKANHVIETKRQRREREKEEKRRQEKIREEK